ncbi:hypothetical protein HZ326_18257 [Fusarium oxysporum f. sp. albedinis]|nr:hypothetical protein HZ326_18257 [Fusarium oxysporum f. sp. albedinis]
MITTLIESYQHSILSFQVFGGDKWSPNAPLDPPTDFRNGSEGSVLSCDRCFSARLRYLAVPARYVPTGPKKKLIAGQRKRCSVKFPLSTRPVPSLNTNFSSSPFSIPTSKSTTRELREACPLQLLVFQVLFSLSRRPSDLLLSDSTVN